MPNAGETYTFRDAATGLRIDLPASWERRSPADGESILRRSDAEYLVRGAAGAPRGIGIIVLAAVPDFAGPERDRPTIFCQTGPAMGDRRPDPGTMRRILEEAARSSLRRDDAGATLSPVEEVEISGHAAYRVTLERPAGGAGSGIFISLQKDGRLINCFGTCDAPTRSAVEQAIASLRFG